MRSLTIKGGIQFSGNTDLQATSPSTFPFQTVQQYLPVPVSTVTLTTTLMQDHHNFLFSQVLGGNRSYVDVEQSTKFKNDIVALAVT
jgi:hypothetical protein